jgi:hypothetical protein
MAGIIASPGRCAEAGQLAVVGVRLGEAAVAQTAAFTHPWADRLLLYDANRFSRASSDHLRAVVAVVAVTMMRMMLPRTTKESPAC